MKKSIVIGSLLITALALSAPAQSAAGWDISINIPFPGLFYYYAPPVMAPAPGPYVYGAPVAVSPMFYGGYWYRPSGGQWFISAQVGGPWYNIAVSSVPMAVMQVPVHTEGGRGHDGRYIPPRLWYEDGGGRGRDRGHGHHDD
jgi:hypothetical protein